MYTRLIYYYAYCLVSVLKRVLSMCTRLIYVYASYLCVRVTYTYFLVDGTTRAAKQLFFFPVKGFVRSLYARPDLIPHLYTDAGERPPGHVRQSRGWKEKMTDNEHMNGDHRNIALVGTTDGVPFFSDQRRGAWPFILRCANLPDTLSQHMSNCHLHLLSANEYWENDLAANMLRRRIRAPKSLMGHMHIIADDLLGAYNTGPARYPPLLTLLSTL
jgi:hypothetical protein